jgi:hypothetical protein
VLINPTLLADDRWVGVVGGNTLSTGQAGVKYVPSIPSVPSAYDPNVTSSFIDGIGRGPLIINGVVQDGYVLIVNSNSGSLRLALVLDDVAYAGGPIRIPVDGGGFVKAYTVG